MKKWKLVLTAVFVSAAAIACGAAVGCKKSHSHDFASEWTSNSVEHWHEATCGDDVKGSKGEHTFDDNYHCTTCQYDLELTGIKVTKKKTDYDLTKLTRAIAVNDISVTGITADNTEITLKQSSYELEYYKGDVQLDNLSAVDGGAYNIWATAEIGDEVYESFVVVYVVEKVEGFERVGNFTTEQGLGLDEMLDTWNFKVTYSSGRTKDVYLKDNEQVGHYKDKNVEIGNYSTFEETGADGKKATVTYTELDCKGVPVTVSENVTYKITNNGSSNVNFKQYSYNGIKATLADSTKDNQVLSQSNFASGTVGDDNYDNSFLTLLSGGIAQYRNSGSNQCLEIKGDTLSVTFEGVGMLVIGCRSTGGTNYSSIAIRGEDGEYVAADYSAASTTIGKDDNDNIYSVTTSSTLTFYIDKPGTYTICTFVEVQTAGDFIGTNRYTRIESLKMTDILNTNSDAEGED